MLNYTFLILGFLFMFFIVGFSFIEIFFSEIVFRIKFPLYILTSILLSTYVVYLFSLVLGLRRGTIGCIFLFFGLLSVPFFMKRRLEFLVYLKKHLLALVGSIVVFAIYSIVLYPAIMGFNKTYFVMAGSNWQDTAMHMSITESLTQGNFPPQAPYYSGVPLNYYYFIDFHSAIISVFFGEYFPKVFVYSNAILAAFLFLSIYTLAYEFSKKKVLSFSSAFLGTFFGSYYFYEFIIELFKGGKIQDLLAQKSYSMEYMGVFGMSNMADYYLQNRPMMIGIPAFVLVTALVLFGYRKKNRLLFIFAGIISGMLIKFQFFSVIACGLMFGTVSLLNFKRRDIVLFFKNLILFFAPVLLFYILFNARTVNSMSFLELIKINFHFGPWDNTRTLWWHLEFLLLNLGLPLLLSLSSLFFIKTRKIFFLTALSLVFILIPYILCFTIAEGDMLKFFYFSAIIFSVISLYFVDKVVKSRFISGLIICIVVLSSTLSSFLTLSNSYLNKNSGYSTEEVAAGLWIRENTPQKSVFITMPTVHSAPTDIGGRLRVISYINWPYSHGFNVGVDNVFSRSEDVSKVYKTGDVLQVELKYKANYIYYSQEERDQFPDAEKLFDKNKSLRLIYNLDGTEIYEILY